MSKPGPIVPSPENSTNTTSSAPINIPRSAPILIGRPLASSHPGRIELTFAPDPSVDANLSVLGSSPPGAHPYKKKGW
ncbi:MAG: hypothetical protein AB7I18_04165 [Candidatus Berkiella sp.]